MKTILIVDDEKLLLSSLSEGLADHFQNIRIFTAINGEEAIKIIKQLDVDLILTDLEMPIMSGFELISYLANNYPYIPVIIMTAYGTSEIEEQVTAFGSIGYVEKPIDFYVLTELIQAVLSPTATGYLTGITLSSLLQLLYLERKSCIIKVSSKQRKGYLYFSEGELIEAEYDLLEGETAIYQIMSWTRPDIEIASSTFKKDRAIHLPLDHLLLEAAKKQDERRRDTGKLRLDTLRTNYNDFEAALSSSQQKILDNSKNDLLSLDDSLNTNASIDELDSILETLSGEIETNDSILVTASNQVPTQNDVEVSEEKLLSTWQASEILFEETVVAFAIFLAQEKIIMLKGEPIFLELYNKASNILEIVLCLSGGSPSGSFEYVNNFFGITFVWNKNHKYVIVVLDTFEDKNSVVWFRKHKGILERNFLAI